MRFIHFIFIVIWSISAYPQDQVIISGVGVQDVVEIGMRRSQVRKQFGRTDECTLISSYWRNNCWGDGTVESSSDTIVKRTNQIYCYDELGLRIIFSKGRVARIITHSPAHVSDTGIRIGDSRETVQRVHATESDAPRLWLHKLGLLYQFNGDGVVEAIEVYKLR
jgi:hypothetical protein